jgi:hypothetical protein
MDEILSTLTSLTSEDNEDLTSGDLNAASVIQDNVAINAVERPESLTVDQLEVCMKFYERVAKQSIILLKRIQTKLSLKYL